MDIQAPEHILPSASDFDTILEATLENTIPVVQATTPERRARIIADARREFAAFNPTDAADARLAAAAIAAMLGAVDSLERAAKPGLGADSTRRLRGSAHVGIRLYKSTLDAMRKRRQQDAEPKVRAAASRKSDLPAQDFQPIPEIELFQPRDRRGKPIPRWRNDLMSKKQKDASYSLRNQAACDAAREEEDAAIAEQAEIDARGGETEPEVDGYLLIRRRQPLPTATTEPSTPPTRYSRESGNPGPTPQN